MSKLNPDPQKGSCGIRTQALGFSDRLLTSAAAPRLQGEVSGRSAGPNFTTTTGVYTCARAGAHTVLLWRFCLRISIASCRNMCWSHNSALPSVPERISRENVFLSIALNHKCVVLHDVVSVGALWVLCGVVCHMRVFVYV